MKSSNLTKSTSLNHILTMKMSTFSSQRKIPKSELRNWPPRAGLENHAKTALVPRLLQLVWTCRVVFRKLSINNSSFCFLEKI